MMNPIRVETVIEQDGELHLTNIECRKGDRVVVLVQISATSASDERKRKEALQQLLEQARASKFRSDGPYPKRDELYDRKL